MTRDLVERKLQPISGAAQRYLLAIFLKRNVDKYKCISLNKILPCHPRNRSIGEDSQSYTLFLANSEIWSSPFREPYLSKMVEGIQIASGFPSSPWDNRAWSIMDQSWIEPMVAHQHVQNLDR